ncbi:HNH endonuclease [Natrinema caseinilyticum]|uniref:HNH endonuclease n=1 Tax=Natrinema caseinilyticum TaxID=2961570 RepID=UPI0021154ADC|nr:HNH endonuclease [Natrinema caseinilyticum]
MKRDRCAVCGFKEIKEDAHVKPRHEFEDSARDRLLNIIPLCPTHHRMFDSGKIGICPNKEVFVLMVGEEIKTKEPIMSIQRIREEYIEKSNSKLQPRLRAAVGLIPSQKHASRCPKDNG